MLEMFLLLLGTAVRLIQVSISKNAGTHTLVYTNYDTWTVGNKRPANPARIVALSRNFPVTTRGLAFYYSHHFHDVVLSKNSYVLLRPILLWFLKNLRYISI